MTTQEAYENMRIYLTRPGAKRAMNFKAGNCAYETVMDGEIQRCAIGCLLSPAGLASFPNEQAFYEYHGVGAMAEWEEIKGLPLRDYNGGLSDLWGSGYELEELLEVAPGFLEGAQSIHDDVDNWADEKFNVEKLDALAERCGLTVVIDAPQKETLPAEVFV